MTPSKLKNIGLTAEGILVFVVNVALAVAAVLPNGLNWTHAGAYIAIVTGLHTFATRFGAVQAIQKQAGFGEATPFNPVDPAVIAQVVAAVTGGNAGSAAYAADKPKAGLAPQTAEEAAKPESTPAFVPDQEQSAPQSVPTAENVPAQEQPAAPQPVAESPMVGETAPAPSPPAA